MRGGARTIDGQLSFAVLLDDLEGPEALEAPAVPPRTDEVAAVPTIPPPAVPTERPTGEIDGLPDGRGPHDLAGRADPGDWHAILDFERAWSGPLSAKQRAVRDRFGIGSARYHQLLDRALERPDALVYDPALVGRLRRLRDARRRKRSVARLDVDVPTGQGGGSG